MSLNDTLNTLGMAVHQASQASQQLENELREAGDRVALLSAKNEQAKKLDKEIAALTAENIGLEEKKNKLLSEIDALLERFKK